MYNLIFHIVTIVLIVYTAILIGAINASIFHIFNKYELFEMYEIYRRRWMPKRCEFCLAFWIGVIEISLMQLVYFDLWLYLAAFAGASLTLTFYRR